MSQLLNKLKECTANLETHDPEKVYRALILLTPPPYTAKNQHDTETLRRGIQHIIKEFGPLLQEFTIEHLEFAVENHYPELYPTTLGFELLREGGLDVSPYGVISIPE